MNLSDELRRLADLRKEGVLTEQEFTDAKRRLIEQVGASPADAGPADAGSPAPEVEEKTYVSSRFSAGNFCFPDKLEVAGDGMLFRKRRLFGSHEEHINYTAVSSVKVTSGMFLADVCIETSGGSQPIFVNGLWKSEAREIQDTIRACQRKPVAGGDKPSPGT